MLKKILSKLKKKILNKKVKVVLLTQNYHLWGSFESLYQAMKTDSRIDLKVVVPPYIGTPEITTKTLEFLKKKAIPHLTLNNYKFSKEKTDVVFFHSPYDDYKPEEVKFNTLHKLRIKIAYIPYGMQVGAGEENIRYLYQQAIDKHAWKIFTYSAKNKEFYGRYCPTGNKHLIITGHPKTDWHIHKESIKQQSSFIKQTLAKAKDRKIILYNPHFSVKSHNETPFFSTWDLFSQEIINQVLQRENDLVLIIRPHPMLFNQLKNKGFWNEKDEQDFRIQIAKSNNIILDENPLYREAFLIADALISDLSSLILEFGLTQKPILSLYNPKGPGYAYPEMAELLYRAETKEQISHFLDMITKGEDPKKKIRVEGYKNLLLEADGNAGLRIKNYIIKHLYEMNPCAEF